MALSTQVLIVFVAIATFLATCEGNEARFAKLRQDRNERDISPSVPVSSYASSLSGKTFNFNNLTAMAQGVNLTFNGKSVNLARFKVDPSNLVHLERILKGRLLADALYVAIKLAVVEKSISKSMKQEMTSVAIEVLLDEDIVMTPTDVDMLEKEIKQDPRMLQFNNIIDAGVQTGRSSDPSKKWSLTICYVISSDFDTFPNTRETIDEAIKHWEAETCVIFVKRSYCSGSHIRFERRIGCWSFIGRIPNGQVISIGPGCETKGIIAREIGHALGFFHEQSRPDRSKYVTIHPENIQERRYHNFLVRKLSNVETFGVPYDYSSLMHYGSHAISKNENRTISTKEDDMDSTIGSRFGLSFYDAKLANLKYCSGECTGGLNNSKCENDGYTDPKNCNICKCPDGWTGVCCTELAQGVNAKCNSKNLTASSSWAYLSSPNYFSSGFPANMECTWKIQATDADRRVVIQFVGSFQFQSYCKDICQNYVEVRFQNLAKTGPRFCCNKPTKYFRSVGQELMLLMRINSESGKKGFRIKYKYDTKCGGDELSSNPSAPCIVTKKSRCPRSYYASCGVWGRGRCLRYRYVTCYKKVEMCNDGFKLEESLCYREWSSWSPWSTCSRNCGGCGSQNRTRTCLLSSCSGSHTEEQNCNKHACPATKVMKKCTRYTSCGFLWWRTCTRYYTCYGLSKCCGSKRESGGICN